MIDKFGRNINYLRISVIDRCNLRCRYCMPENGIIPRKHEDVISFEEIIAVIKIAVEMGFNKFRLTGGEPLLRRGIVDLIAMIAEIKGVEDFAMTTNGILLAEYADKLKQAGLQRINVSLDTLDAERFSKITRGGNLQDVLNGISAAKKAGLFPIKINCLIGENFLSEDRASILDYAHQNGYEARFISEMDLKSGKFQIVKGGTGGDCTICNRLRLLSNGDIRPCLFNDISYNIRQLGIEKSLLHAIENKPKKGICTASEWMYSIGG